jgi:cytochrome oxidase Cu insertion factor (SCO1/SenC/PrrC family)
VPCKQEIKNIKGKLESWKKEADFNYMTVSIDDSRNTAMVKTYSKSQGWNFPVLLDPNSDLKRSLNFQNVPYTIIVDQNGKIIYQHTGYEEGGENELFDMIKKLANTK